MEPDLVHPIPVEIEQIDKGSTEWDGDAREAIRTVARTAVKKLNAQISWSVKDDPNPEKMGISEETRGYLLFKKKDLSGESVTINRGDKISKIGYDIVELYVTGLTPVGHYPDQGGASLLIAYFGDRNPRT